MLPLSPSKSRLKGQPVRRRYRTEVVDHSSPHRIAPHHTSCVLPRMRGEQLNVSILIVLVNLGFAIRSASQQLVWTAFSFNEFFVLLLHSVLHQAAAASLLYVLLNVQILSEYVEKVSGYYTRLPNSVKLGILGLTFLYIVKHHGIVRILMVSLISARAFCQLFHTSKVMKAVNKFIDKTGLSTIKKSKKPADGLQQRSDYLPSSSKTPASISRISNIRGVTPRTDLVSKRLFNDNDHIDNRKTRNGVSFYSNNSIRTNEKPARKPRSTPYHKQSSQASSSRDNGSSSRYNRTESPDEQEPVELPKSTHEGGYNAYTELVQPLMATSGKAFDYAKEYSTTILSSLSSYIPAPSQNVAPEVSEGAESEQIGANPQKSSNRKRHNPDSASPAKRPNEKGRSQQGDGNEMEIEIARPNERTVTFTDTDMEETYSAPSGKSPKNARGDTAAYAGSSSIISSITSVDSTDTAVVGRNHSTSSTMSSISFSGLNSDGLNVGVAHKRRKATSSLGYASDQTSVAQDDFVMRRKYAENLITTDMKVSKSESKSSSNQVVAAPASAAPSAVFMQKQVTEVAAKSNKEELIDEKSSVAPKSSGFSIFTDSVGVVAAPVVPVVEASKPSVDVPAAGKIERVESALFPLLDDAASKPSNEGNKASTPAAPVPTINIFPEYSPNRSASGAKVSPSKKPPPSPIVTGGEVPGIAFNSSLGKNSSAFGSIETSSTTSVTAIFGSVSSGASSSQLPPLSLPPSQPPVQRVNLFGNDATADAAAKSSASTGISAIFAAAAATAVPNTVGALPTTGETTQAASAVPASTGAFSFGAATASTVTPAANPGGFSFGGTSAPASSAAVASTATSTIPAVSTTGFSFGGASAPTLPAVPTGGMGATNTSTASSNATAPTSTFGAAPLGSFGSTPAVATSAAAPAGNLFGSAPSVPSVPSFGGAAPASSAAPFSFGASTAGSSIGSATSTSLSLGGASTAGVFGSTSTVASNVAAPASNLFGSTSTVASNVAAPASNLFGSTSTVASNVAAPASNLFGSTPSVPSFGATTVPPVNAAPFTFGAAPQGSSATVAPTLGFNASSAPVAQGSLMFGGAPAGPFGSTSAPPSTAVGPASNLFGSSPSAPTFGATTAPITAAPFTFGATPQGTAFLGSQNQPPNPGMMGPAAGGMFSLGTTEKRPMLKAKKK